MTEPTPLYEYPATPASWANRIGDAIGTIIAAVLLTGGLVLTVLAMVAAGDWLIDSIGGC